MGLMSAIRDAERLNPVAEYCRQFFASGKDPVAFASFALARKPEPVTTMLGFPLEFWFYVNDECNDVAADGSWE